MANLVFSSKLLTNITIFKIAKAISIVETKKAILSISLCFFILTTIYKIYRQSIRLLYKKNRVIYL